MKRKKVVLMTVAFVLLGGLGAGLYADFNKKIPTMATPIIIGEGMEQQIAREVLEKAEVENSFLASEVERVDVYYGNILDGEEPEAVVAVCFGPKSTFVVVYASNGDTYEYYESLGYFYAVNDVDFIPIKNKDIDAVVIQEEMDQRLGSFELTEFLKGYLYDGNMFLSVVNVPTDIDATWYESWGSGGAKDARWQKIVQDTDVNWNTVDNTTMELIQHQSYLISDETGSMPEPESFQPKEERIVEREYFWSDAWFAFILGEGIDKESGERIAILDIRADSPYSLAEEGIACYQILRKGGEMGVVAADCIELIDSVN